MKKRFYALTAAAALAFLSAAPAVTASADTFATTYYDRSNLAAAPAVVAEVKSRADFERYLGEETVRPASLILPVDGEGNVVAGEERIGTLASVYGEIKYDTLAIAEVNDEAAAEALVGVWKEDIDSCDFAVMSKDAELLKEVREALPTIRGIYDCRGLTFEDDADLYEAVKRSTVSMATILVLSAEQATVENIEYLQYRFKTVWTQLKENSEVFDVLDAVAAGAFGLVTDSAETVYQAYKTYPKRSICRASANVAHRGLPYSCAENSLEGGKQAYASGATHLEIDVHLTKDGVPVVMHDSTIDRTTDGTGSIESMTVEQLENYPITKNLAGTRVEDPQPIPTAEDFFKEFQGKDVVLVFEIKTGNTMLFPALIPLVEKYDFYDQLVFISFNEGMLREAKEKMPQVPTAYLGGLNAKNFEDVIANYNRCNMVVDTPSSADADFNEMLKNRGYACWFWTYSGKGDSVTAMAGGAFGITNNMADEVGTLVRRVSGIEGQTVTKEELTEDSEISLRIATYAGAESTVTGKVHAVRDCGEYAEVIATYNENAELMHFTRAFRVDYAETGGGLTRWGIVLIAVGAGLIAAGAAVTAVLLLKKKGKIGGKRN